jgi:hypothetical protein
MDGHAFSKMDRNKSTHKLQGLPAIYWLNLDADTDRRFYMEEQFKYWDVNNHTRISGYDAREDDASEHLKGRIPDNVSQTELGCCMSHLKAIKHFYEETDDEYCMILEDDVDFSTVKYWNFTWQEFSGLLPYDWDCIQMTAITTGDIHVKLHLKYVNDFSAAAYLISRHHAAKLMKHHIRGDKYKLDNGVKPRAVSEDTILETGKTYTIPIFLYNIALGSTIHAEHIGVFHKGPHDALSGYWQHQGTEVDIREWMNYDPYLGRIAGNSASKAEQPTENPPT